MADLYPFATGSWSTNSNWYNAATGTTVNRQPTTGDNVWLNNKTITLDTTITCDKLSNKAFTGTGFSPAAGGSVTVALTNVFYPTITVGSGGIESVQSTVAAHVISLSGSSTTGTTSKFLIDCAGDITGGYNASGHTINIACTGTKIQINANNVQGGITTGDNGAIYLASNGNTVYVNCTNSIISSVGTAIRIAVTTTSTMYVKATTITGGSSTPAIRVESNTSGVYIGYTCDFSTATPKIGTSVVTDINASSTSPAIQSYTATAPYISTTPFYIQATNLNGSSNGVDSLMIFNGKLTVTNIKYYDTDNTLITYQNQTPTASTAAEFWAYLTSNATTSGSLGKLIVDNLNAKVGDVKTSTDRIPTNPASVQSTGDQIATLQ